MVSKEGQKRYSLVLPNETFTEVQKIADRQHTTVVEMLRKFIKLGLIAAKIEETPGASLLIREGDTEREILIL